MSKSAKPLNIAELRDDVRDIKQAAKGIAAVVNINLDDCIRGAGRQAVVSEEGQKLLEELRAVHENLKILSSSLNSRLGKVVLNLHQSEVLRPKSKPEDGDVE